MKQIWLVALGLALTPTSAAQAQDCAAFIEPVEEAWNFAELAYFDFGEHRELMIGTPSQPEDFTFRIELDGAQTSDLLALPGLDNFVVSLTPPDGDLALTDAFVDTILSHKNLTIYAMLDEFIEDQADYDLTKLVDKMSACF